MTHARRISVTGLGYVGLPVAVAFGRHAPVVGFDTDPRRIAALKKGHDVTGEVGGDTLRAARIEFTGEAKRLAAADFHIVAVPTPVDGRQRPDLVALEHASASVGGILKAGDVVVYESTVFPGATEEICVPLLERHSKLRQGRDFFVGYSPERINPGDAGHRFENITKVVAGDSESTRRIIAGVYASVVRAGVYEAPSIRVAECAKVIENTQRDLNIALMNELAMVCERLGLDSGDVIRTAATKWNFLPFTPGLVGGHCIGVDPYYLTHKATSVGYTPHVILAGRSINDGMGAFIAGRVVAALQSGGIRPGDALVTLLGLTFKENIPDTRNSGAASLLRGLQDLGVRVQVHDPFADREETEIRYGVKLVEVSALVPGQAVVLAVAHAGYRQAGWPLVCSLLDREGGVVFDVKGILDRGTQPPNVSLLRL